MKGIIILMLITISFSAIGITNQKILNNLDYSIDSKFSEKTEINEFSEYYNISIAQVNIYNAYLARINSSLREFDGYLNLLAKKDLFLENVKPLNVLGFDKYKDIDVYQYDLFKIIKKQEIDRIMNLGNDYRKLFVFMIEDELEIDFWQNIMLDNGELYDYIEKDTETKNNFYEKTLDNFIERKIKDLGDIKKYIYLVKKKINKIIIKSGSIGGAKPRERTMEISDDWSEGDRIRLSNYLKQTFDDLQVGDIFLVDNGNGDEFILGYHDHATMLTHYIVNAQEEPLGGQNIFISSWGEQMA